MTKQIFACFPSQNTFIMEFYEFIFIKMFGVLNIMFIFAELYMSLKQPNYESFRILFVTGI